MILHGIYDNGNIQILDKEIPNLKANVDIIIHSNANSNEKMKNWDNILKIIQKNKVEVGTINWSRDSLYER